MTRIELLYFDGCPNRGPLLGHVRELLLERGMPGRPIELVRVDSHEGAAARGSPACPTDRSAAAALARVGLDASRAARAARLPAADRRFCRRILAAFAAGTPPSAADVETGPVHARSAGCDPRARA